MTVSFLCSRLAGWLGSDRGEGTRRETVLDRREEEEERKKNKRCGKGAENEAPPTLTKANKVEVASLEIDRKRSVQLARIIPGREPG